jgi:hypothetical protein
VNLLDSGPLDYAKGDGLYTGSFIPSIDGEYTVVMHTTGTSGSVPFSRVATTRFMVSESQATFVANSFSDNPQLNAAGIISQVTVSATANIQVAGTYTFSVDLKVGNGEIAQGTTTATLPMGTQQLSVIFQASDLLLLAVSEPYERVAVTLSLITGSNTSVAAYQDAGPTAAYALSSFDRGALLYWPEQRGCSRYHGKR